MLGVEPRMTTSATMTVDVGRLTLLQSIGCIRLVLWDEASRKLVSFRQLRRMRAASPSAC